jgi:hypothetical protein
MGDALMGDFLMLDALMWCGRPENDHPVPARSAP